MKFSAFALTVSLAAATSAIASPIKPDQIAADAKWVLHLDVDELRNTKLGAFFIGEILDKKAAEMKDNLKRELNFDLDWSKISSVTAFGMRFGEKDDPTGVLLIRTSLDIEKGLASAMAKPELSGKIEKSEGLYSIDGNVYISAAGSQTFAVSKSRESVDKARSVIAGKAANMGSTQVLKGYGDAPRSFFFLGVADALKDNASIPPQANVLKNAEGGRLVVGEKGDNLFANLVLKATTSETAEQMQQVFQGLVALGSLTQNENPELAQLVQSTKVTMAEKLVTVQLEFPIAKAIKKIAEKN